MPVIRSKRELYRQLTKIRESGGPLDVEKEKITRLMADFQPRRGRHVGSRPYANIDMNIIGLADLYCREHPDVWAEEALRASVTELWNKQAKMAADAGEDPEQACISLFGASIETATTRCSDRVRQDVRIFGADYPFRALAGRIRGYTKKED